MFLNQFKLYEHKLKVSDVNFKLRPVNAILSVKNQPAALPAFNIAEWRIFSQSLHFRSLHCFGSFSPAISGASPVASSDGVYRQPDIFSGSILKEAQQQ